MIFAVATVKWFYIHPLLYIFFLLLLGHHTPHLTSLGPPPAQRVHLTSSAHQFGTNPLDHIAFSIANDRAVRMLKIQAIKVRKQSEQWIFICHYLQVQTSGCLNNHGKLITLVKYSLS